MRVRLTRNNGATNWWRFAWLRYPNQYRLEAKQSRAFARLPPLPFVCLHEQTRPEVYYPLEDVPGLSRLFTQVTDADEVLKFANTYGVLGFQEVPRRYAQKEDFDWIGEPVIDWLEEAELLRRVYQVFDLIETEDEKALKRIIHWSKDGVSAVFGRSIQLPIAHAFLNTDWLKKWKFGEVIQPAKLFILDQFNFYMAQMASPVLLLNSKGDLQFHNAPASLLAALWLEFGQLVTGARRQRLCESCGQWMDVTNNWSHKRKHDRCALREKMARYRQNKRSRNAEE